MSKQEAPIGLFPANLVQLLPTGARAQGRLVPLADADSAAAQLLSGLAALWWPAQDPPSDLPLYALGPAAWQGRRVTFAADGAHRMVAARAVETLLGLTGAGPLPPSATELRRRMLRDVVQGRQVVVAGGGKVGRAAHALLRAAHVRSRLITGHPAKIPATAPWSALGTLLPLSAAVIWASERPILPWLDTIAPESPIVVVPDLTETDLRELAAVAPERGGIAVTLYRPFALPATPGLVVLSDSPRRQASAMALFLRHLEKRRAD